MPIYPGKFCAVWWPESLYYIVVEISTQDTGRMREVDRGQCYSVAWTTFTGDKNESFLESDSDGDDQSDDGNVTKAQKVTFSGIDNKDDADAKNVKNIGSINEKEDEKKVEHEKVEEMGEEHKEAKVVNNEGEKGAENVKDNEVNTIDSENTVKPMERKRSEKSKQVIVDKVTQTIDMCAIITPRKVVTSGKEKKGGFFKKNTKDKNASGGGILPSMVLMKDFHSVDNAMQPTEIVSPTGSPDEFDQLHGGGPLICITSKIVNKAEGSSNNAISQIEQEAAALVEEAARATVKDKVNDDVIEIPPYVNRKSQFYYLTIDELSEKRNVADKFVLTPMGPAMAEVSMVVWDSPQSTQFTLDGADIYTQKVAVLIKDRINVLVLKGVTANSSCRKSRTRSRSSSKYTRKQSSMSMLFSAAPVLDKITLTCQATCQVGSFPYSIPSNMYWENGTLFAATACEVHAVFPLAQSANRADKNDESGHDGDNNTTPEDGVFTNCFQNTINSNGHLIQWGGSMADALIVSSLRSLLPNNCWHTSDLSEGVQEGSIFPQMLAMPYGHVEVIGVDNGYLLVALRDLSVAAVPLTASPMVSIACFSEKCFCNMLLNSF